MTTHRIARAIAARACLCAALTVAVAGLTVGFSQADHVALDTHMIPSAPAPASDLDNAFAALESQLSR